MKRRLKKHKTATRRKIFISNIQFSSVQLLSRFQLFETPWIAARQASLSITNSWSSLKFTSIKLVMPSSHLILWHPLFILPPIPPSIRVFSNESTLRIRWPKYWSFSFSIIPSNSNITFYLIMLNQLPKNSQSLSITDSGHSFIHLICALNKCTNKLNKCVMQKVGWEIAQTLKDHCNTSLDWLSIEPITDSKQMKQTNAQNKSYMTSIMYP